LLEDDRGLDVAHPHAAVGRVDGDAEEGGLTDRIPGCLREALGLVTFPGARGELACRHVACERPEGLLVLVLSERIDPVTRHRGTVPAGVKWRRLPHRRPARPRGVVGRRATARTGDF